MVGIFGEQGMMLSSVWILELRLNDTDKTEEKVEYEIHSRWLQKNES
jgi:hypothetical protein